MKFLRLIVSGTLFVSASCASPPSGSHDGAALDVLDGSGGGDSTTGSDIVAHDAVIDAAFDSHVPDASTQDSNVVDAPPTDVPAIRDVSAADATPTDGAACTPMPYVDLHASERASCTFAMGSHASATLGDGTAARAAIQHLIILLHENRSLDHYFGHTGHGIEGLPATFTNPDSTGTAVHPYHYASGCACDIPHGVGQITSEWDHGAMDGFIRTDGMGSFGYYLDSDHPFYTWLVTTFATSDRYFCAALDDTGHNRHFLWHGQGTYAGPAIFGELDAAHVTWTNFYDRTMPLYNDLNGSTTEATHLRLDPGLSIFYAALRDGTGTALPQLSIIDQSADEHPAADIHRGEAATRELVQNVLASPLWPHIALIYTYDEGGGFLDHVPPPAACVATTMASEAGFDHLGVRVPIAVVSPWSIPGYVSHTPHSHSSITRLIEMLYDLPALTQRDANSDALLDMFDFHCPQFLTPPTAIPMGGATGCPATCASGP